MELRKELELKDVEIGRLQEYENNAKKHPEWQVKEIANSIQKLGFRNPICINDDYQILAGHGRFKASQLLGLKTVPCIVISGMTELEEKAFMIADNKLALNTGFDLDKLKYDLNALKVEDFDIEVTGFTEFEFDQLNDIGDLSFDNVPSDRNSPFSDDDDDEEIDEEYEDDIHGYKDKDGNIGKYTSKIQIPIYEMKGNEPELEELYDHSKVDEMLKMIEASNLSLKEKQFLRHRAFQLTKFDFGKVAEYYAHQDGEMQDLMEKMAMVIIDYDKALENGFVKMSKTLNEIIEREVIEHEAERE